MTLVSFQSAIHEDGWFVTPPIVPAGLLENLLAEFDEMPSENRAGSRYLLAKKSIRRLVQSEEIRELVEADLGSGAFACRAILFDQTPSANWNVVWHQDLTIAVRERVDTEGFGPWSRKVGVPHTQAPTALLTRMLAVRVHLDDCGVGNGPLQVLPSSHRSGKLSGEDIDAWVKKSSCVSCLAERGSLLAFRPLLLHRSLKAAEPSHRRVIHLEFAAEDLPDELVWYERTPTHG